MFDPIAIPADRFRCARVPAWAAWPVTLCFVAAFVSPATPAHARIGDSAWAQCVWRTAPVSADNWLAMEAPVWADNLSTPAEILGHRLIAVCADEAADERRPNRNPNWRRLASALRGARPRTIATSEADAPHILLCRHHAARDGAETLYRVDIVRVSGEMRTTLFQQYFAEHEGRPVRLPQDLRVNPPAEAELSVECRPITDTGNLADA